MLARGVPKSDQNIVISFCPEIDSNALFLKTPYTSDRGKATLGETILMHR